MWDAQEGGQMSTCLLGHRNSVMSVAFSPDGSHILSGSRDNAIQVWDAQIAVQVGNPPSRLS